MTTRQRSYAVDGTNAALSGKSLERLLHLPKPVEERPTFTFVQDRHEQLSTLWRPTHAHWDVVDEHVKGINPLWKGLPSYIQAFRSSWVVRSGKARKLVDTVVSQFLVAEPKVHRKPVGDGEGHEEKADQVKEFDVAWLKDIDGKTMEPVTQTLKKHLAIYNYAVLEGVELVPGASERLPAEVEEGRAKRMFNPTIVLAPHPKTVLMDPRKTHPDEAVQVVRVTRRALREMAEEYGNEYSEAPNPYEEVKAYIYWSNDWHCVFGDGGEEIVVERNPYQSPPFVHKFGPLGMVSGDVDDAAWLRWKCVGILEPVLDVLTEYDETLSALAYFRDKAAYIKMRTTKDPTQAAQEAEGNVVQGEEADWGWLSTAKLPDDLWRTLERCERDIEQGTFPRLLGGFRPEGVATASQNSQLNVQASLQFQPFLNVMEQMTSHVLERMHRLIISWGHPVTVDGFSLSPEDLEGDDNARVEYPYKDVVLELERRNDVYRRLELGLVDKAGALEEIGHENPSKVFKGLIRDQLRQHPALIERDVRLIAEEDGVAEIIAEWERQQFAQGQGQGLVDPRGNPIGGQGGAPKVKPGLTRQPNSANTPKPPAPGMSVPAQMAGR